MKSTRPTGCLSMQLLLFVRDERPTEGQMLEWLGPSDAGCYHILRKEGLLLVQDGVVILNPANVRAGGAEFSYRNLVYRPDEGILEQVLYADRPWLRPEDGG